MSFSNNQNKIPKVIRFRDNQAAPEMLDMAVPTSELNDQFRWLIAGQGVFLFQLTKAALFALKEEDALLKLSCANEDKSDGLRLELSGQGATLYRIKDGKKLASSRKCLPSTDTAFYWLSLDSHNFQVLYGIGEARLETQALCYKFDYNEEDEEAKKSIREFLEGIKTIDFAPQHFIKPLKLLRDPVVQPVALKVKGTAELTMDDIANNSYVPKSNLSPIGQKLYDNISGHKFVLNTPDFPQFTQAIEYSIATKGCWCYKKLKEKSTEFGDDNPEETYLRITLGQNSGESPGVPYVMEIWPPGHYSPVHHHAGANALIRVLHGAITVKLFPFLGRSEAFAVATFSEGDVTWISPDLNQIHQLKNLAGNVETCITIQCYMYDLEDEVHYDYFNYIDDKNEIHFFDPNSDKEFAEFKAIIKKEWDEHLKKGELAFLKES